MAVREESLQLKLRLLASPSYPLIHRLSQKKKNQKENCYYGYWIGIVEA